MSVYVDWNLLDEACEESSIDDELYPLVTRKEEDHPRPCFTIYGWDIVIDLCCRFVQPRALRLPQAEIVEIEQITLPNSCKIIFPSTLHTLTLNKCNISFPDTYLKLDRHILFVTKKEGLVLPRLSIDLVLNDCSFDMGGCSPVKVMKQIFRNFRSFTITDLKWYQSCPDGMTYYTDRSDFYHRVVPYLRRRSVCLSVSPADDSSEDDSSSEEEW